MNITKIALESPVGVWMGVACLIVFGVSSVSSMPIESTPEMNMPIFMVRTSYTNASPEEVDKQVTDVIEKALSSVSEYTTMTSRSSEGSSMTNIQFDYNVNLSDKRSEIDEALQNLRLPDDASTPVVMEMSMDSDSIMTLSILASGDKNNLLSYI